MPPNVAAPILAVTSPADSAHFYCDLFGFTQADYFHGNDEYLIVALGDVQIHLMLSQRSNPNHRAGNHVADAFIWVADVDSIVAAAASAGLIAQRGPESYGTIPVSTTEVVYEDPDGYWICFATATKSI